MKKISIHDYAKALYEVTKDRKGAELKKATEAFAALLLKHNNIKKMGAVVKAFEAYAHKQAGEVTIEVITAREIDKTTLEHIKKVFGEKVEATQRVQEDLIGGVIIKTEDTILDGSLKKQLQTLQAHLA